MPEEEQRQMERGADIQALHELMADRDLMVRAAAQGRLDPEMVREMDTCIAQVGYQGGGVNLCGHVPPPTHVGATIDAVAKERERYEALQKSAEKLKEKRDSWWPF